MPKFWKDKLIEIQWDKERKQVLEMLRKIVLTAMPDATQIALAGHALALAGFFFQIACGFALPFPLNLILLPLRLLEWWLAWTISFLSFVN